MQTQLKSNLLFSLTPLMLASVLLVSCDKTPTTADTMVNGTVLNAKTPDAEVANRVKTALQNDADLKALNINVAALNGDVTLTGEIDSQSQLDQIDKLVRGTEGVVTVNDELSIRK